MRAHELLLEHYAQLFNEGGQYGFGGARVALLPPSALATLRRSVERRAGADAAQSAVILAGWAAGADVAEGLPDTVEDAIERRRSVATVARLLGVVEAALPRNVGENRGPLEVHWYGSIDQEPARSDCDFTTGFVSGYLSTIADEPLYFIEESCIGRGDEHCVAHGRRLKDWVTQRAVIESRYDLIEPPQETLADVEKRKILEVVATADTRDEAAEILGIGVATLFRRLKKYGVT